MYAVQVKVDVMRRPHLDDPRNVKVGELPCGFVDEVALAPRLSAHGTGAGASANSETVFIGHGWVPRAQLIACTAQTSFTRGVQRYGEHLDFNSPSRCLLASYSTAAEKSVLSIDESLTSQPESDSMTTPPLPLSCEQTQEPHCCESFALSLGRVDGGNADREESAPVDQLYISNAVGRIRGGSFSLLESTQTSLQGHLQVEPDALDRPEGGPFKSRKWFRLSEPIAVATSADGSRLEYRRKVVSSLPLDTVCNRRLPHVSEFGAVAFALPSSNARNGDTVPDQLLLPRKQCSMYDKEILEAAAKPKPRLPRTNSARRRPSPAHTARSSSPDSPTKGSKTSRSTVSKASTGGSRRGRGTGSDPHLSTSTLSAGSLGEGASHKADTPRSRARLPELKLDEGALRDTVVLPLIPVMIGRGVSGTVCVGFQRPTRCSPLPALAREDVLGTTTKSSEEGGDGQGGSSASESGSPRSPSRTIPQTAGPCKFLQQVTLVAKGLAAKGDIAARHALSSVEEIASPTVPPPKGSSKSPLQQQNELLRSLAGSCPELQSDSMADVSSLATNVAQPVAVKTITIPLADRHRYDNLVQEINTLRRCNHPNIVSLHGAYREGNRVALVMELLDAGTLQDLLDQQSPHPLQEWECASIFRALLHALFYLHHHLQVVHRDVKPCNILLSLKGEVKLADLGVAKSRRNAQTFVGTDSYIAPEVWKGKGYDEKVDLFSAGVVLQYMLTGDQRALGVEWVTASQQKCRTLRKESKERQQLRRGGGAFLISQPNTGPYVIPKRLENALCADALSLVNGLVHPDPRKRMTIPDALLHPFLRRHEAHPSTRFLQHLCESSVLSSLAASTSGATGDRSQLLEILSSPKSSLNASSSLLRVSSARPAAVGGAHPRTNHHADAGVESGEYRGPSYAAPTRASSARRSVSVERAVGSNYDQQATRPLPTGGTARSSSAPRFVRTDSHPQPVAATAPTVPSEAPHGASDSMSSVVSSVRSPPSSVGRHHPSSRTSTPTPTPKPTGPCPPALFVSSNRNQCAGGGGTGSSAGGLGPNPTGSFRFVRCDSGAEGNRNADSRREAPTPARQRSSPELKQCVRGGGVRTLGVPSALRRSNTEARAQMPVRIAAGPPQVIAPISLSQSSSTASAPTPSNHGSRRGTPTPDSSSAASLRRSVGSNYTPTNNQSESFHLLRPSNPRSRVSPSPSPAPQRPEEDSYRSEREDAYQLLHHTNLVVRQRQWGADSRNWNRGHNTLQAELEAHGFQQDQLVSISELRERRRVQSQHQSTPTAGSAPRDSSSNRRAQRPASTSRRIPSPLPVKIPTVLSPPSRRHGQENPVPPSSVVLSELTSTEEPYTGRVAMSRWEEPAGAVVNRKKSIQDEECTGTTGRAREHSVPHSDSASANVLMPSADPPRQLVG